MPRRTRRPCGRRSCAARRRRSTSRWLDAGARRARRRTRRSPRPGCPGRRRRRGRGSAPVHLAGDVDRRRRAAAARVRPASRRSRSRRPARGRASGVQEREPAAEAEPDREQRRRPDRSSPCGCGRGADVGRDARPTSSASTWGMYSKPSLAPAEARRPAEAVDREGVDAVLGEPQRELLVVRRGGRGRRAGSRSRRRSARRPGPRNAREPVAVGRVRVSSRRVERAAGDRQRSAAASRGRST